MHFECITIVGSMYFTQGGEEYFYSQIMGQLYIIIFIKCLCPVKCVHSVESRMYKKLT